MANFYSQMMCRLLFNTSSRKNKNITRFVVRKFLDVYNAAHVVLYPTIPVLTCFRCKICASVFQQGAQKEFNPKYLSLEWKVISVHGMEK